VSARVRLPLVAGVALNGQDRALILADSANGLSLSLPLGQWFSIRPTMTATLLRPPAGDGCTWHAGPTWLATASDLPTPTCSTRTVGEVAQPLLVQKRTPGNGAS